MARAILRTSSRTTFARQTGAREAGEPRLASWLTLEEHGKYGTILVRDRRRPVACITPASEEPEVNRFAEWRPLKRFAAAIDRPVGGTPVEDIVSADRNR